MISTHTGMIFTPSCSYETTVMVRIRRPNNELVVSVLYGPMVAISCLCFPLGTPFYQLIEEFICCMCLIPKRNTPNFNFLETLPMVSKKLGPTELTTTCHNRTSF